MTIPLPPIRREVWVPVPSDVAFTLFTNHIGSWWPMAEHSVLTGSVAFESDLLVERSATRSCTWAEVVEWEPPTRLTLNWHPGRAADTSTDLRISFEPTPDGTLVRLEHSGWERLGEPDGARQEYGQGWPVALGRFGDLAGTARPASDYGRPNAQSADETPDEERGPRWYALLHTPGPVLVDGGSVFAHPDFAEHLAFLNRLLDRGLLVAAGPLDPGAGTGMTVVRAEPDIDVEQLARHDDQAVVRGLLAVEVTPWHVRIRSTMSA